MVTRTPPEQPDLAKPGDEPQPAPEVIADKGRYLLRITDASVREFRGHYPTADDPQTPAVVNQAGVQVTKEQGQYLQLQAAQHGVATSLDKVDE